MVNSLSPLVSRGAVRLSCAGNDTGSSPEAITDIYVARILGGAGPSDLPILQSVKFELMINLRTAKSLGIAVPAALLALGDEVIE